MYDQIIDVIDELCYLGVMLESTRDWNKHKTKQMVKGNQLLSRV
jgi:hypothetical protein